MRRRRMMTTKRSGGGAGRAIGLDIGATSVRAASLTMTAGGSPTATLERAGSVRLPPGTVVNGTVEDPAALTGALRTLWQNEDFGGDEVIVGVANPQVVVRDLRMPAMEPQQRAKALPFLAREIIALPVDVAILDFIPLGPPDPDSNQVDGLLVATPRLPVLAVVGAVEAAGLQVGRVDLSSFAVLRSAAAEDLEVEAVVDLGAHLTTIVIHRRGVPRLVRTLARGGQELTERLSDRLGMSPEAAEAAKREHGLSGARSGEHEAAAGALREALRPLMGEIRSSINYFRSGNAGARLDRLALTGGGAALPGLAEALAEQVGAPTVVVRPGPEVGDWWDQVAGAAADTSRAATSLSVGLAMGAAA